jgi:hypothetical protein
VDAAKDTHDQGAVHCCGQSFADNVAHVEADEAIWQAKEINEIAPDLEEGSAAECDFDAAITQRCAGEKGILNEARFPHVIVADATTGKAFHFGTRFGFGDEFGGLQEAFVL